MIIVVNFEEEGGGLFDGSRFFDLSKLPKDIFDLFEANTEVREVGDFYYHYLDLIELEDDDKEIWPEDLYDHLKKTEIPISSLPITVEKNYYIRFDFG